MSAWDDFYGPNAGYALELYDRYLHDPNSVDAATREYFAHVAAPQLPNGAVTLGTLPRNAAPSGANGAGAPDGVRVDGAPPAPHGTPAPVLRAPPAQEAEAPGRITDRDIARIVGAARLARSIREHGHLAAQVDPLGTPPPGDPMLLMATHGITEADLSAMPASIVWPDAGPDAGTGLDAINRLRAIYSGPLGYDFDHVQTFSERAWLRDTVESGVYRAPLSTTERRALLRRLSQVEGFERFLHTTFQGQKRFSIEGTDMLVPMLDELVHDAAVAGTREALIGMAHRGRLSVLAHLLGKPLVKIFSEFHSAPNKELVPSEGSTGINYGWTGDVKYHLGAHTVVREGEMVQVQVTMAHNPSHLEFVNPVIEGFARSAQERRDQPGAPRQHPEMALPVVIHGDAAFPGEGVVAETLNLSRLPGYQTGGTIHIIVNNQIGFTTAASDGRSTLYASDLAKGFEIPIIHVNADDPEACVSAIRLAHAYRARFHKDFLLDLVGYRRWGHNEGDEPSFTQPLLYAAIADHPTVRALYADALTVAGVVAVDEVEAMQHEVQTRLRQAQQELADGHTEEELTQMEVPPSLASIPTALAADTLRALNEAMLARPVGFEPHPRLERLLVRRREAIERPGGIDWGLAEALAFASILADGTPIRLSGQDSERGTFSHRHMVLHDAVTNARYVPLQALMQARASFAIYNSPLSEAAVLGFEYGYSVHAPETLVLWEAQFGDFANAGQVVIDQFIAAARAKWRQHPSLVLLLPHGYEGQGPEHSSGRVERYLQLAAEDNLRIVNCTTAAQYFHLLRAQAGTRGDAARPLVVLTPKSLLRHPRAASSLLDLAEEHFEPVLVDAEASGREERIQRLILCSGKVAIDLATTASGQAEPVDWIAVARVEQLYPFPADALGRVIAGYPQLREIVWLQEEPRNMGAWSYVAPRLRAALPGTIPLRYIGRPERASTAEGLADMHTAEQAKILEAAFANEREAQIETRGTQDVG